MPADMLVTQTELADWLQTPVAAATATLLIAAATAKVQEATRQRLVFVAGDVDTIEGTPEARLPVPQRPAVAITSVALDGQMLAASEFSNHRAFLFRPGGWQAMTIPWWVASATPFRFGLSYAWGAWDRPLSQVTITYDHGYQTGDPMLEPARAKVLQLAAAACMNPQALQNVAVDDYRAAYFNKTMTLDDDEKRELRRTYGRFAGSIRTPT